MQVNVVDARVRHTRRFHSSRSKKKKKVSFSSFPPSPFPSSVPIPFYPPFRLFLLTFVPFSNFLFNVRLRVEPRVYSHSLRFRASAYRASFIPQHQRPRFRNCARVRNFSIIQRFKTDLPPYNSLLYHLFTILPFIRQFFKTCTHRASKILFILYIYFFLFIYLPVYIYTHGCVSARARVCVYIYTYTAFDRSSNSNVRSIERSSLSCRALFL